MCKKSLQKAPNISKNESIFKMTKTGHGAKAIAFEKSSIWAKNYKCQNGAKNDCTTTLELMCEKNRSKKTANIREMRAF